MSNHFEDILLLLLMAVMLAAAGAGYWFGYWHRQRSDVAHIEGMETIIFGLLSLLLAFSVSMAENRYLSRAQRLLDETNAIGTVYANTDFASPELREEMRKLISNYLDDRIAFYQLPVGEEAERALRIKTDSVEAQLWSLVSKVVSERPMGPMNLMIAGSINTMFDLRSTQDTLYRIQIPVTISRLLIFVSMLALGAMSYRFGFTGKPHVVFVFLLTGVIAFSLFVIFDLDRARLGWIKLAGTPLVELKAKLNLGR